MAKQRECMDHAGDRGARAGADVGRGAGDGAGGGNAAEERRGDVGDALGDEFDVGVVAVAGHAVGDDGGEHAFKRGQQRDGEGRGNQRQNVLGVEVGNGEGRKSAGNAAEAGADGFDRQMEQSTRHGTSEQRDDGCGNALGESRQDEHDGQRCGADCQRLPVEAGHVADQQLHAGQEFAGNSADAEAEESL